MMYDFIVNPHSRSARGLEIWSRIETILKQREVNYHVHFTKYRRHATEIARELTEDLQEHTIVALGGDGTVNEVVNGISDYSKVIFGYIPSGSGNDFARGLGLSQQPEAALEAILNPTEIRPMDVGVLRYASRQRCFVISAGIGFDAAICHQAAVSKIKRLLNRLRLGKMTYTLIALYRLMLDQPVRMQIQIDDQEPQSFESVYFSAVMNNLYEGGGFKFCPQADSSDGILDVILVSNLKKWQILLWLVTAYSGRHVHSTGVFIFSGKKIRIDSSRALPVHTDGEPVFLQNHLEFSPAQQQLRVILR